MKRKSAAILILALSVAPAVPSPAGDGAWEIAEIPYTITTSGHYVVTRDLALVGTHLSQSGISVLADDVVIDLNGWTLSGGGSTSGSGIYQPSTNRNLTVQNGQLIRWANIAIMHSYSGGLLCTGEGNQIRNLQVRRSHNGIVTGPGSIVEGCSTESGRRAGIRTLGQSVIRHCTARSNSYHGIIAGPDSVVEHCSALRNEGAGIQAGPRARVLSCLASQNGGLGVHTEPGSTVEHCQAIANQSNGYHLGVGSLLLHSGASTNAREGVVLEEDSLAERCRVHENARNGFVASNTTRIVQCAAFRNGSSGIRIEGWGCHVADNVCYTNGHSGILATSDSSGNRIADNTLVDNVYGIYENGSSNVLTRNFAVGNGWHDYFVNGSDVVFPLSDDGSTPAAWANFGF